MRTSHTILGLLASTLVLASGALHAREFGVELQANGGTVTHPLPEGTTRVELEQPLAGGCRQNQSWGYDLRAGTLWVAGNCGAQFRIYTRESPRDDRRDGWRDDRHGGRYDDRDDGRPSNGFYPPVYGESGRGGREIRGQNGLCLDIEGGLKPGNALIVYRCSGTDNQRFVRTPSGELRVGHLCLDVEGGNRRDGTRVVAWECRNQPNQRWSWERGSIRSQYTGTCLDIEGGRARSGQPVVVWPCSGAANQRWN